MSAVLQEFEIPSLYPALSEKRTAMPVVPEGARQSTMNINSMHGGQAEPEPDFTGFPSACVPDSCRMVIDRRYIIEEDPEQVPREVTDIVARVSAERNFDYEIRELWHVSPTMTEKDAPVVQSVSRSIEKVLGKGRRLCRVRPAPTTKSTSTASAASRTASPTARASSILPTSRTNMSASTTWSTRPR